jgi:uncharacterized protein (UPF0333 family)
MYIYNRSITITMDRMDVKGQASVEYLLLTLIFLIIIGSITVPLISQGVSDSLDVSHSSDASAALNSIANAVGVVYANGPGSQRNITVYFSNTGTLSYVSPTIQMPVNITGGNKLISANVPITVTFVPSPMNIAAKNNYNAEVYWPTGSSSIMVNMTEIT